MLQDDDNIIIKDCNQLMEKSASGLFCTCCQDYDDPKFGSFYNSLSNNTEDHVDFTMNCEKNLLNFIEKLTNFSNFIQFMDQRLKHASPLTSLYESLTVIKEDHKVKIFSFFFLFFFLSLFLFLFFPFERYIKERW